MTTPVIALLITFATSFSVAGAVTLLAGGFGMDDKDGIQKFHARNTSRLGGVGIFFGVIGGLLVLMRGYDKDAILGFWMIFISLPVFIGGITEDITRRITARTRLKLALLTGLLTFLLFRMGVTRTDLVALDWLINIIPGLSLLLTIIIISGFINSVNIIDGFHGVASGAVLIMLCGFIFLGIFSKDYILTRLALVVFVSNLGFLVWNWPWGKIFLGDGGAYLLGYFVVIFGLLLIYRNQDISPMAPVLIGVYPLTETVYTMYRRKYIKKVPVNKPDALHLHSLIYRRLIIRRLIKINSSSAEKANPLVALIIYCFIFVPVSIAVLFRENTTILFLMIALFVSFYVCFYGLIVRFKTPPVVKALINNLVKIAI
jgi:UDP-N-acetylmuramyl pentapeptide phosphotransferase/UDP-N-acetylglucosamine-1-phosphate transferase